MAHRMGITSIEKHALAVSAVSAVVVVIVPSSSFRNNNNTTPNENVLTL
jgi:hypothetical protein